MKYAPLPFLEHLKTLPPEEAQTQHVAAIKELVATNGWQLVLASFQELERTALQLLQQGRDLPQHAATIRAVNLIRSGLSTALRTTESAPDLADTVEEETLENYHSDFLIP